MCPTRAFQKLAAFCFWVIMSEVARTVQVTENRDHGSTLLALTVPFVGRPEMPTGSAPPLTSVARPRLSHLSYPMWQRWLMMLVILPLWLYCIAAWVSTTADQADVIFQNEGL